MTTITVKGNSKKKGSKTAPEKEASEAPGPSDGTRTVKAKGSAVDPAPTVGLQTRAGSRPRPPDAESNVAPKRASRAKVLKPKDVGISKDQPADGSQALHPDPSTQSGSRDESALSNDGSQGQMGETPEETGGKGDGVAEEEIPDDSKSKAVASEEQQADETVDGEGDEKGAVVTAAGGADMDVDEVISSVPTGRRLKGQVSTAKGKGKGKANAQESDDEIVSDDDDDLKASSTDSLDAYCWSKVISYAQVDLLNPPVPWLFGVWNPRLKLQKKVNDLVESFLTDGVQMFRPETDIYLIIKLPMIAKECITDAKSSATAKPLQLSARGNTMEALTVAGGRHRYEALKICKETTEREIKKYQTILKDFAAADELSDEDVAQRHKARGELVLWKEKDKNFGPWGVVMFNEGTEGIYNRIIVI
jgi:hypothetical protein